MVAAASAVFDGAGFRGPAFVFEGVERLEGRVENATALGDRALFDVGDRSERASSELGEPGPRYPEALSLGPEASADVATMGGVGFHARKRTSSANT